MTSPSSPTVHRFPVRFFIGFLVSAMWGQINTADSDARAEGAAAVQMATDAGAFEPADRDGSGRVCWHTNKPSSPSGSVTTPVGRRRRIPRWPACTPPTGEIQANTEPHRRRGSPRPTPISTRSVRRAPYESRGPRRHRTPVAVLGHRFLTSAMVLGTAIIYGVERRAMHYPMVAIVGVIVAANLFLLTGALTRLSRRGVDVLRPASGGGLGAVPTRCLDLESGPGRGDGDLGCPPCRSTVPRLPRAASAWRQESRSSSTRGARTELWGDSKEPTPSGLLLLHSMGYRDALIGGLLTAAALRGKDTRGWFLASGGADAADLFGGSRVHDGLTRRQQIIGLGGAVVGIGVGLWGACRRPPTSQLAGVRTVEPARR